MLKIRRPRSILNSAVIFKGHLMKLENHGIMDKKNASKCKFSGKHFFLPRTALIPKLSKGELVHVILHAGQWEKSEVEIVYQGGLCLIGSVCVYPLGWESHVVTRTCGQEASKYTLGDCSIRWAYVLAVIGCFDAFILATLAFILATRHVKLQPEPTYTTNGSLYKGEVNGGFMGDGHSMAGSRKSLNLHPVLLMPQPGDMDRYSEFSNRTGRSKTSVYRPEYASSMQNFQL